MIERFRLVDFVAQIQNLHTQVDTSSTTATPTPAPNPAPAPRAFFPLSRSPSLFRLSTCQGIQFLQFAKASAPVVALTALQLKYTPTHAALLGLQLQSFACIWRI